jgi:glucose/mannose-6-phosphate isomerase
LLTIQDLKKFDKKLMHVIYDEWSVLIQGQDDNIHTKIHWKIIKEFFVERGIKTIEIESLKGDILSKIINLIYILDYATVYRAVLNEVDPFTIEPINYIKERV